MLHHRHVIVRAVLATLFIITAFMTGACAQPSGQPATKALKVNDIVGKREWKPSEENSLICAAEDPKNGDLTYTWSAEKGSLKGEGQQVYWTAPDSLGDYSITVKVVSNKGGETTFSKKFKVTDNPYNNNTADKTIYLNLALPSSNPVTKNGRLRTFTTGEIECVVEGGNAAELNYKWTAPAGKLLADNLNSGKVTRVGWIAPGAAGSYTVSVTVTDKEGRQATGEVVFEVLCCRDP